MPQKITDITKKIEDPQEKEVKIQPEHTQEAPRIIEVEKKIEAAPSAEILVTQIVKEEKGEPPVSAGIRQAPAEPVKSPILEKIEDVLQEDLEDIYFQLTPEKQEEFRQTGEQTASQIAVLMGAVKIQVTKILGLIIKWLRIIPHVNRYFLEQEAKIKTDKLIELRNKGEIISPENQNKI
ncbi:MAG: hypothetical protein WC460_04995 [Patescibacteria group bacterium]